MNTGEFFDKVESMYKDWQYDHPRLLYSMIRLLKPSSVIEVGTFMGYGACYMARALEDNDKGHLHCIDNWQLPNPKWRNEPVKATFSNALSALGLSHRVTLIEGDSDKVVWPKSDFVYIDGWHSYKACLEDWELAVGSGATCICLDDSISVVGPRAVVADIEQIWLDWDVATLNSPAGFTICTLGQLTADRQVTFSQEIEGHPGLDLKTPEEIAAHLEQTGIKL